MPYKMHAEVEVTPREVSFQDSEGNWRDFKEGHAEVFRAEVELEPAAGKRLVIEVPGYGHVNLDYTEVTERIDLGGLICAKITLGEPRYPFKSGQSYGDFFTAAMRHLSMNTGWEPGSWYHSSFED